MKEEKENLISGEGGLNEIQQQMTDIEATISKKYPEISEAMNKYKEAQKECEDYKSSETSKAKDEVNKAQKYINDINTEINKYNNKQTNNEYSINPDQKYNTEAGQKLANNARNVPGTFGLCLKGVSDSLKDTYGVGLKGLSSAYMAADALRGNNPNYKELASHFVEVEVSRADLANLPAGAVVVWNNNANGGGSNVSAAGKKHGHISIALGNGQESSDHIQKQMTQRDAEYSVFLPIS